MCMYDNYWIVYVLRVTWSSFLMVVQRPQRKWVCLVRWKNCFWFLFFLWSQRLQTKSNSWIINVMWLCVLSQLFNVFRGEDSCDVTNSRDAVMSAAASVVCVNAHLLSLILCHIYLIYSRLRFGASQRRLVEPPVAEHQQPQLIVVLLTENLTFKEPKRCFYTGLNPGRRPTRAGSAVMFTFYKQEVPKDTLSHGFIISHPCFTVRASPVRGSCTGAYYDHLDWSTVINLIILNVIFVRGDKCSEDRLRIHNHSDSDAVSSVFLGRAQIVLRVLQLIIWLTSQTVQPSPRVWLWRIQNHRELDHHHPVLTPVLRLTLQLSTWCFLFKGDLLWVISKVMLPERPSVIILILLPV